MAETSDLEIGIPEELYQRLRMLAAWRSLSVEEFVRSLIEAEATRPEPPGRTGD